MTEPTNPSPADEPKADETFSWTTEPSASDESRPPADPATSLIDSVRDAIDELAERAAPTVRELSARAAELTAIAADRAAPLVKRAGEATADASGRLAERSREWASELRASLAPDDRPAGAATPGSPEAGSAAAETPAEEADPDGGARPTGNKTEPG